MVTDLKFLLVAINIIEKLAFAILCRLTLALPNFMNNNYGFTIPNRAKYYLFLTKISYLFYRSCLLEPGS